MLIQRGKRIFPGSTLSTLVQIVSRKYSKEVPENLKVPLSIAAYQIWGANTDVGKTLVSAGLMKEAVKNSQALYLKPVQTGFPSDSDAALVGKVAGLDIAHGNHASELLEPRSMQSSETVRAYTDFAWKTPVSPHLAVKIEGRPVKDAEIQSIVSSRLQKFSHIKDKGQKIAFIETAGGPGSPGPSGRLQCDIFRPLRLPAFLVGDGKLGGISTTLAAYEMLIHRGYEVACIALLEDQNGPNFEALQNYLSFSPAKSCPIFRLPVCEPPSKNFNKDGVDHELQDWLGNSKESFRACMEHLCEHHARRVERIQGLPADTLKQIWYPFTQHQNLGEESLISIDGRCGEHLQIIKEKDSALSLEPSFDACASWWTQGVSEELQPVLVSETMKGIARYGHIIHPQTVIEPVLDLANLLLEKVGQGWAERVFYSDDGTPHIVFRSSTAIEVALKMAFRKFWVDHPELDLQGSEGKSGCSLKVVGIDGGYHGDTLGAMDAVSPSPYNGPKQYPWYSGRGLFLNAPYIGLKKGTWKITSAQHTAKSWTSIEEVLDISRQDSNEAQSYEQEIEAYIDRYESAHGEIQVKIGACIIEPIMQGAGGMLFIDPVYQRALVKVSQKRKIPVICDEVFTGLWRMGSPSASQLLGIKPDIACFAKLLTGGILPLAATLASKPVFEAFLGPNKLDGLLHGHSYSGHCAGASAGCAALKIFSNPKLNPALGSDGSLKILWPPDLVHEISHNEKVASVVALGTVLAVELETGDGGGYASSASISIVNKLKKSGIFARPLGSTVYLLLTPTTRPEKAQELAKTLLQALKED